MSYRTRIAAAGFAVLAVTFAGPAANAAGPHSPQRNHINGNVAHRVANIMADRYLVQWFEDGDATIGRCADGDPIWHCPMLIEAKDSRCTADVWVWSTNVEKERYWAEIHRLRCGPAA